MKKQWKINGSVNVTENICTPEDLLDTLLTNRGIISKDERQAFLNPDITSITPTNVGIKIEQLEKAVKKIQNSIEKKEQIIIYGDYDVDGVTASAILWETLRDCAAQTLPYIPHRIDEGYGLSIAGIKNLLVQNPEVKLIITVDNGIVAHEAVEFANNQGVDVIITDHHQESSSFPKAHAIVYTHELCGAGVAWLLSKELRKQYKLSEVEDHLSFAALGTIADLVPLVKANRAIVKEGLKLLNNTKRPGLLALFQEAALSQGTIGVYEVGHIIAPRLNAMGRLESAMDSLRLLCTSNAKKAWELASMLGSTNRERQLITFESAKHASEQIKKLEKHTNKLLFIADAAYPQGVIGLIAGKLVEEFYRPAIVLSIGEIYTKASVRSVSGVNIIELLRMHETEFVNIGGHPMAAGFTIETSNLALLEEKLNILAKEHILDEHLVKTLKVDCELPLENITAETYESIQSLSPFGMGNPEPVFASREVEIGEVRLIGKDKKHLKIEVRKPGGDHVDGVAFGMGEYFLSLKEGSKVDMLYAIDLNEWNGKKSLQLKIKDVVTLAKDE